FVPQYETLFLNLHQTPPEVLTSADSAMAWVLRVMQEAEEPQEELIAALEQAIAYLEQMPEEVQSVWRRAMLYLFLLVHHKRDPSEEEEIAQRMVVAVKDRHQQEIEEMAMTSAQVLEAKGRREGRIEGQREVLLQQLEFKFGPLSDEVVAVVNALSRPRMREL